MIRDTDQAQLLLEDAEAVTPVVSSIVYSGVQTVIEADCLEYMATMETGSVAAVVTSPPYNLGKKYASYNDNRPLLTTWRTKTKPQLRLPVSCGQTGTCS
jgi:hypothetical protein